MEQMIDVLGPQPSDMITIEKVAVMVGIEITESVFFGCLESVRGKSVSSEPVRSRVGYFFGGLKNQVPNLYDALNSTFVSGSCV